MRQDPGRNPFRPGVGTRPTYLAGRSAPLRRFEAILRSAPEQPANVRMTGLRGVGKTVLLGEFERLAGEHGWAACSLELNPRHNTDEAIVRAVAGVAQNTKESLSRAARLRGRFGHAVAAAGTLGISFHDIKLSLDPVGFAGTEDIARELLDLVDTALGKGLSGAMLFLDEAQVIRDDRSRSGDHPLSLLVSAVSALQRREVPVGLTICGLPTLAGNLLKARSYTERMFRGERIDRLERDQAEAAFTRPLAETAFRPTKGLVREVVEEVEGYPFFIQLWGAELWDAARVAGVKSIAPALLADVRGEIYERLDIDFYEPRVSTLTPAEQDVLLASADCPYPPLATVDLNDVVDKRPGNVNVLLGRLVEAGVLYRLRKGQYEYTAPKFREYLVRRHEGPVT